MAYRNFRQESYFDAPNVGDLPRTLQALNTVQRVKQQRQQRQYDLENDWKTFVAENKIPSLSRKINQGSVQATQSATNAFRSGYKTLPPELRQNLDKLHAYDKEAVAIEENLKRINEQIEKKRVEDKYYIPDHDLERAKAVAQDNDLPIEEELRQKNQQLTDLNSTMGKDVRRGFNREQAVVDFVNSREKSTMENDVTDPNGIRSKVHTTARFRDKDGKPGITGEAVVTLLDKDPRLYESYFLDAADEITNEWKQFKASGKTKPMWTNFMTDQQVMETLSKDPAALKDLHPEDPNYKAPTMWDRIEKMAKRDIKKHEAVSLNSLYDAEKYNEGSVYGLTSDKFNAPADGFNSTAWPGPSRKITTKSNVTPYITFPSIAKARINTDTGAVTYSETPKTFTMTGYQWSPYTVDDKGNKIPMKMTANTEQEMIAQIAALTPVQRQAIKGVAPVIIGQSLDKARVLDAGFNKRAALEERVNANPTDEEAKTSLAQLDEMLETINAGGDLNGQLIQKFIGADVLNNEMFIPDERDTNVTDIASRTGMDIYSKKSRNPAMNYLVDEVQKLRNQPIWTPDKNAKPAKAKAAAPPVVTSKAQYDALPAGAQYKDADGNTRTKGGAK